MLGKSYFSYTPQKLTNPLSNVNSVFIKVLFHNLNDLANAMQEKIRKLELELIQVLVLVAFRQVQLLSQKLTWEDHRLLLGFGKI